MSERPLHDIPHKDPVSGQSLYVSELTCDDSGVVIRGRFAIPKYSRLEPDQAAFLEAFLRCRGVLSCVERELGISYPTVRNRLDALLEALGLPPARDESPKRDRSERTKKIIEQLERGEITPEEAKKRIREGVRK